MFHSIFLFWVLQICRCNVGLRKKNSAEYKKEKKRNYILMVESLTFNLYFFAMLNWNHKLFVSRLFLIIGDMFVVKPKLGSKRIEEIVEWNLLEISVKRPFCCTVSIQQVYFTYLWNII